jgi:hypothetical protein
MRADLGVLNFQLRAEEVARIEMLGTE